MDKCLLDICKIQNCVDLFSMRVQSSKNLYLKGAYMVSTKGKKLHRTSSTRPVALETEGVCLFQWYVLAFRIVVVADSTLGCVSPPYKALRWCFSGHSKGRMRSFQGSGHRFQLVDKGCASVAALLQYACGRFDTLTDDRSDDWWRSVAG